MDPRGSEELRDGDTIIRWTIGVVGIKGWRYNNKVDPRGGEELRDRGTIIRWILRVVRN